MICRSRYCLNGILECFSFDFVGISQNGLLELRGFLIDLAGPFLKESRLVLGQG